MSPLKRKHKTEWHLAERMRCLSIAVELHLGEEIVSEMFMFGSGWWGGGRSEPVKNVSLLICYSYVP